MTFDPRGEGDRDRGLEIAEVGTFCAKVYKKCLLNITEYRGCLLNSVECD